MQDCGESASGDITHSFDAHSRFLHGTDHFSQGSAVAHDAVGYFHARTEYGGMVISQVPGNEYSIPFFAE